MSLIMVSMYFFQFMSLPLVIDAFTTIARVIDACSRERISVTALIYFTDSVVK